MRKRPEAPKNFADVHVLLKRYLPPVRSQRGAYTLERMEQLMNFLGNPQNSYKIIHVAGTSGKTSTCYYIAALLKQAGVKTGLTVSPHIDELNERVQIGLKPMPEKRYCKEFGIFCNLVEKSRLQPTYFEVLTAFAFWEFKRQACEYAVVEVGMGGLLDATNVMSAHDKLDIITDIGLDHQSTLGDTEAEISSKKAGIIKPYNTVVCYEQGDDVMGVIREVAENQSAELHEIWPLKAGELPRSLPLFQRRNWYLAFSAFSILRERDKLPELDENQLKISTEIYVPARMEKLVIGEKTLIMDGAHNQQKLEALVQSLRHDYPHQKIAVLASFVATKQTRIKHCLSALLPICSQLIITTFATENQERVSVDPLKIADSCEEMGFTSWQIIDDPAKAISRLMLTKGDTKLVTGSFYLLNHVRDRWRYNNYM